MRFVRGKKPTVPWYYITRAVGCVFLIYGLVFDTSSDRGTIILTGAGLVGIDKVARSEQSSSK
jgi:hypothetical protein